MNDTVDYRGDPGNMRKREEHEVVLGRGMGDLAGDFGLFDVYLRVELVRRTNV